MMYKDVPELCVNSFELNCCLLSGKMIHSSSLEKQDRATKKRTQLNKNKNKRTCENRVKHTLDSWLPRNLVGTLPQSTGRVIS